MSSSTGLVHVPDAPCVQLDPEIFFAASTPAAVEAAKAICRTCPYIQPCRLTADLYEAEHGEQTGVWGGVSAAERRNQRTRTAPDQHEKASVA